MQSIRGFILFSLILFSITANSQKITIDNQHPRTDQSGEIVDAHDGRVIRFGDTFYWYGTAYGTTNGFTTANYYQVYSSPDLRHWKKEGRLLPDQPEGVYYRPHVIYNAVTDQYVLWYNWYPELWNGQFGVAVSDRPEGPFRIVNDDVQMARSEQGLGDFGLFVDDDGTAYISYNTIQNHQVSIEKLNQDYTGSTMENGGIIAQHMEAGSQFKRDGLYYLLTDYTCCFCNYGSGARVYISDDPMKGYVLTGNINRYPGRYAPVLSDGVKTGTMAEPVQVNDSLVESVEILLEEESDVDRIKIHIFTGNRSGQCGEVDNPRVHPKIGTPEFLVEVWDYDVWKEVDIRHITADSSALSMSLDLHIDGITGTRIRLTPKPDYPFQILYINEISLLKTNWQKIPESEYQVFITGAHIPRSPVIPAQQKYVMRLETVKGPEYVWMGDLWGSASDNVKGHDYQYWSAPLKFNKDGTIRPMQWVGEWSVRLSE